MSATLPSDGGAAFPRVTKQEPNGEFAWGAPGMSMRDWFAGHVLVGVLANPKTRCGDGARAEFDAALSRRSYQIADAMLAERAKERQA